MVVKQVGLTYQRDAIETKRCVFLGAGEGNIYALSYLSDDDSSSLAVDAEGQTVGHL